SAQNFHFYKDTRPEGGEWAHLFWMRRGGGGVRVRRRLTVSMVLIKPLERYLGTWTSVQGTACSGSIFIPVCKEVKGDSGRGLFKSQVAERSDQPPNSHIRGRTTWL